MSVDIANNTPAGLSILKLRIPPRKKNEPLFEEPLPLFLDTAELRAVSDLIGQYNEGDALGYWRLLAVLLNDEKQDKRTESVDSFHNVVQASPLSIDVSASLLTFAVAAEGICGSSQQEHGAATPNDLSATMVSVKTESADVLHHSSSSQKLTLKLPKLVSPVIKKVKKHHEMAKEIFGFLDRDKTSRLNVDSVLESTSQKADEQSDEDDKEVRLTIVADNPVKPKAVSKRESAIKSPKKLRRAVPRPPAHTESDDDEAMLRAGTEVDGFIYYPTKRTESSDDKCHPPTEASATIPPNPTTQGRQRRQAAINNKLVSGGHVSDTNSDGEFRPAPKRRSSAKVSVKKQKVDMDDPQNKLAKVKASLVTTATSPVLAAKTISTAWPTKLSAKQRLSKKLGLNKR